MKRFLLVGLLLLLVAASSCSLGKPSAPRRAQEPPAAATVVDAYPTASNTAADVAAARAIVAPTLSDGITADMLRRPGKREEIPLQWWDAHRREPYKIVVFVAQSARDRELHDSQWMHTYTVVQERPGSEWVLFLSEEGV